MGVLECLLRGVWGYTFYTSNANVVDVMLFQFFMKSIEQTLKVLDLRNAMHDESYPAMYK